MGCLKDVIIVLCLGSPSVMWSFDQLDRSFVPLPFDRFTFSMQIYEPRQPVHHAARTPFRSWLCVPAFQQVCRFCAVWIRFQITSTAST